MANTYSQLYIHLVFAVLGRQSLIQSPWKEELQKWITGMVQNRGHKLIKINCMPDHAHILIGLNPKEGISDLVREIKSSSSKFINERRWIMGNFRWQEGFGAFSYSRSQLDDVIRYIENQERRHQNYSFQEEYLRFLKRFEVEFDAKYVFAPIEDGE